MSRGNRINWSHRIKQILKHLNNSRKPFEVYVTDLTVCPRKAFFNIYYAASPPANGFMSRGKLLHYALETFMKKELFPEAKEIHTEFYVFKRLRPPWKLVGKIDVLVQYPDGFVDIVEFKFSKSAKYSEELQNAYIQQLLTYTGIVSEKVGVENVRPVLVIIDFSQEIEVTAYEIEYRPEVYNEMLVKAEQLVNCIEHGTPPGKEPTLAKECEYCPWKKLCENV